MSTVYESFDDAVIASAVKALEHYAPDSELRALRLAELPEPVLEKNIDRLCDALMLADPPMAMRILNVLPAAFTRRHAQTYVDFLNRTGDHGYAAGAFVTFKARSAHRTNLIEWNLDKALWKWVRYTDTAHLEQVVAELGPDWGLLWADYVAVVHGSGRLSRRLHRIAAQLAA